MTRKQVMQNLVKQEAKNLKKNATQAELGKLSFSTLKDREGYASSCIYGQLTGNCFSGRAGELIFNSCIRVYTNDQSLNNEPNKDCLTNAPINGKPEVIRNGCANGSEAEYFSPIEVFISQDVNKSNGNNEKLIKYLRGEIKTLNFK